MCSAYSVRRRDETRRFCRFFDSFASRHTFLSQKRMGKAQVRDIYNKCWVLKTSQRGQKIKKLKRYITFNSKEGQKIEKRAMTTMKAKMYNTRKVRKMLSELTIGEKSVANKFSYSHPKQTGQKSVLTSFLQHFPFTLSHSCRPPFITLTVSYTSKCLIYSRNVESTQPKYFGLSSQWYKCVSLWHTKMECQAETCAVLYCSSQYSK